MFEIAGGIILAVVILVVAYGTITGFVMYGDLAVSLIRDAFLPLKHENEAADEEEARLIRWNNRDRQAAREALGPIIVVLLLFIVFLVAR
jgi:hypothetical protein